MTTFADKIKKIELPRAKPLLREIIDPLEFFIKMEASGGILLIAATVVAMTWANLPVYETYFSLIETPLGFSIGDFGLTKTVQVWINDGLMALFFLLVGLEIKRETQEGELSTLEKASLPAFAAVGGMVVPALFFVMFNYGKTGIDGWGIPMATDIAFALGILSLLGKRVPTNLKLFLIAVAIVDDIGAVLIIAIFYTSEISITYLVIAGFIFLLMAFLNNLKVYKIGIYLFLGAFLWFAMLKSGVHATVAGILIAITIPGRPQRSIDECLVVNNQMLRGLNKDDIKSSLDNDLTDKLQNTIQAIKSNCQSVLPPLLRLEHRLNPWVAYIIMPVFAFANAGTRIDSSVGGSIINPVSLGIIFGLLIGKPLGIGLFSILAVKTGASSLPLGVRWKQIIGAGFLGGIGFTMAFFINSLAFASHPEYLNIAKLGILAASTVAALIGLFLLYSNRNRK